MFIAHQTEPTAKEMRRAQAEHDALFDPSRKITVSVVPHIGLAEMPFEPRWMAFQTTLRTNMREVLGEIHRQLPKVEHPFEITTSGPRPQTLDDATDSDVMTLLDPLESNSLVLRLRIYDPVRMHSTAKPSLGSRLLNALARRKEPSSAPPSYEASVSPWTR